MRDLISLASILQLSIWKQLKPKMLKTITTLDCFVRFKILKAK